MAQQREGQLSNNQIAIALVVMIPLMLWGVVALNDSRNPPKTAAELQASEASDALAWSQVLLKRSLKSPGSAKFDCHDAAECVSSLGEGRYRVRAGVDSQNDFGAMLHADFDITVQRNGPDNWSVVEGPRFVER